MYKVVQTKEFNGLLRELLKGGGPGKAMVTKARAAQTEAATEGEIRALSRTRHGESRLPDIEKYDLGDGYRLVVQLVDSKAKTRAFLFCGKHDDAEHWLDRHKNYQWVKKPSDSTLDFVQVSTAAPPESPLPDIDLSSPPSLLELPLLRDLTDEQWRRIALPAAAERYARELSGSRWEEDATGVLDYLSLVCDSGEQANLLLDLLSHAHAREWPALHKRVDLYYGQATVTTGSEAAAAMTAPENSELFVSWDDANDLPLDGEWADWMLFLHPEQKELATRELNGPARLRGVSGSGKTCVIVHRARHLAKKYQQRVIVATLTKSMRDLLDALLRKLCGAEFGMIEVMTVATLAKELCFRLGPKANWKYVYDLKAPPVPDAIREAARHAEAQPDFQGSGLQRYDREELISFLTDEISYVRSRLPRTEYDTYLSAKTFARLGRGRGLSEDGRRVCLAAIRAFDAELDRLAVRNPESLVQDALNLTLTAPVDSYAARWRCVLVDEVQDLSQLEVSLLAGLRTPAGERVGQAVDGLFLVGDGAQSVYKRGFRLAASGVNVSARSFAFKKNYRNTREILAAAYGLIRAYEFADVDEDNVTRPMAPDYAPRHGERPLLVKCDDTKKEMRYVATQIKELFADANRANSFQVCVIAADPQVRDAAGQALSDVGVKTAILKEDSSLSAEVVKISTIESAKGHEFTHVFIPGLAEGILPRDVPDDEMHREAARLYVAMTRARDFLCLTYTSNYEFSPSRFLTAVQSDCTEMRWTGFTLEPMA